MVFVSRTRFHQNLGENLIQEIRKVPSSFSTKYNYAFIRTLDEIFTGKVIPICRRILSQVDEVSMTRLIQDSKCAQCSCKRINKPKQYLHSLAKIS